jgi:hypothetical protein
VGAFVGAAPVEAEPPGEEPVLVNAVPDVAEVGPGPPPDADGCDGPPGLPQEVGITGTGVGLTPTVPWRVGPVGGGSG